jgi:uncharacterized protein YciI
MLRQHFVYWWELEEAGNLLGAGPTNPGTPSQSGMALVVASSLGAAEALAFNEPLHVAGWRRNSVRLWQFNEGLAVPLVRELST